MTRCSGHLAWLVLICQCLCRVTIFTASSKAGGYVGFELPHIAAYLSVAAELSVVRVSIRCASSAPLGAPCPLGSGLGKMPGASPCYSPPKSIGTWSGGVPGA